MASTSSSLATFMVFLFLVGPTSNVAAGLPRRRRHRRAFFVFGDSLVDYGNNNYLLTTARADCPPYGIDYPTGQPTGRFSNGLNIPDIIAEKMGLATVLPFLSPDLQGFKLLDGANFASAGVGLLNDTGIQFVDIIRIWCQLENFESYQHRVAEIIGRRRTRKLVNEAVFLITCGGNDFVNNYFLIPYSKRSLQYSLPDYVRYVISEYRKVLLRLYDLGARTILVPGPGPMGCAPAEIATRGRNGECFEELQQASAMFNQQIREMGRDLNRELGEDVFITANTNLMHLDLFSKPEKYGFVSSSQACCGQGAYNGIGICTKFSNLCSDRNLYLFWDPYHPCEKATRLLVEQIFEGSEAYMHPMNLTTHMEMFSRTSWRRHARHI